MTRLMVVDDSRFIFEEMRYLLQDTEFEIVKYCRDASEAIHSYEAANPDLVTMDIILPDIDGFDAARAILQQHPQARFVFISSLAYDATIQQARELGAVEFLFKPFDKEQLVGALSRANGPSQLEKESAQTLSGV